MGRFRLRNHVRKALNRISRIERDKGSPDPPHGEDASDHFHGTLAGNPDHRTRGNAFCREPSRGAPHHPGQIPVGPFPPLSGHRQSVGTMFHRGLNRNEDGRGTTEVSDAGRRSKPFRRCGVAPARPAV